MPEGIDSHRFGRCGSSQARLPRHGWKSKPTFRRKVDARLAHASQTGNPDDLERTWERAVPEIRQGSGGADGRGIHGAACLAIRRLNGEWLPTSVVSCSALQFLQPSDKEPRTPLHLTTEAALPPGASCPLCSARWYLHMRQSRTHSRVARRQNARPSIPSRYTDLFHPVGGEPCPHRNGAHRGVWIGLGVA